MRLKLLIFIAIPFFWGSCKSPPKRPVVGKSENARPGEGEPSEGEGEDPNVGEDGQVSSEVLSLIMQKKAVASCATATKASQAQLRLLTRKEYQNTLSDILKFSKDLTGYLPVESRVQGFENNVDALKVSEAALSAYLGNAMEVATTAAASMQTLASCQSSEGQACAEKFLTSKGDRLWRRALTTEEKTSLLNLYKSAASESKDDAMILMISTMLISPNFLYRFEVGKDGALTPYEKASALSYFFWGRPADDELWDLAKNGKLATDSVLVAQAKRLLASDKARFVTSEFAEAWLSFHKGIATPKDKTAFPKLNEDLQAAMGAEVEDTLDHWIRVEKKGFADLFTADTTLANADLAAYYGETATQSGGISLTKFKATPRRGVLGFGALLSALATTSETHPIKRGEFVMKHLLCQTPEPTPMGLMVKIPDPKPGLTTRERYALHSSDASCKSCHEVLDGIGFGMEDYDGSGAFRTKENGKDVDATGQLVRVDGKTTAFEGGAELGAALAKSREAKRCYAVQWFRMANGHLESQADVCSIRAVADEFEKGSMSVADLLVTIITNPTYNAKGK